MGINATQNKQKSDQMPPARKLEEDNKDSVYAEESLCPTHLLPGFKWCGMNGCVEWGVKSCRTSEEWGFDYSSGVWTSGVWTVDYSSAAVECGRVECGLVYR